MDGEEKPNLEKSTKLYVVLVETEISLQPREQIAVDFRVRLSVHWPIVAGHL